MDSQHLLCANKYEDNYSIFLFFFIFNKFLKIRFNPPNVKSVLEQASNHANIIYYKTELLR